MSVQPSAPLPSAGLADLGDAALRARAEPANSASNVIPFVRPKRERAAPAIVLGADDRPAPPLAPARDRRVAALLAGSLLLHGALYAMFDRPPAALASIGLEAMMVEIVLGAETPAGLAQQASESEAQPSAPAPDQAAEAEKTEVAQAEPPPPADPAPEAASEPATQPEPSPEAKTELATAPPDPPEITAPEPAPLADLAREAPPPPPLPEKAAKPAPEKPAPPVREAARHPTAKPKPPERETGRGRPTAASAASAASSSGIGRGRSDADSNYPGLVAAHLARHKRFPAEARGRGEQGVATVRFTLDGSGRVSSVALVRPTGIASLDRESQDVVRRASPFPPPPSGKPMSFTVPVRFSLM